MIVSSTGLFSDQTTSSVEKQGRGDMGKDQFLTLLVAQLKYQDPLSPMENTEFVAQMAQFSSLEQLTNINAGLESLQLISASSSNTQALNLIGKEVEAAGNSVHISDGKASSISFSMPEPVSNASIHIMDSAGTVVRTLEVGALDSGTHEIRWNGKNTYGSTLPNALYSYVVDATNGAGKNVNAETFTSGIVESISMDDGVLYLQIGDQSVLVSEITKIRQPANGSNSGQDQLN